MQSDIEAYHASYRERLSQKYTAEQADDLATIQTSMMFNLSQLSGMKFNDFVRLNPIQLTFDEKGKVTSFTLNQEAWHGSGANFDRFDTSFMGTGEGAQAHGWGLYFAEDKDTGEAYREKTRDITVVEPHIYYNNKISTSYPDFIRESIEAIAYRGKENVIYELKNQLAEAVEEYGDDNTIVDDIRDAIEVVRGTDDSKVELRMEDPQGQLYNVEIPDNDVLLDEQKPFDEQPEKVQEALKSILANYTNQYRYMEENGIYRLYKGEEYIEEYDDIESVRRAVEENNEVLAEQTQGLDEAINKNYSGRDIYNALSQILRGDKQASLLLLEHGIKGITYDGRQDGRCYVIFDGADTEIKETLYQDGAKTYEAQLEEDSKKWAENVDRVLDAKANDEKLNERITVMKTPLVLSFAGASFIRDNEVIPLEINASKIQKIDNKNSRHQHFVSRDTIKKLPQALAEPLAIFDSPLIDTKTGEVKEKGCVVVVPLLDDNGVQMIAAIHIGAKSEGSVATINKLASYYGVEDLKSGEHKTDVEWFNEQFNKPNNVKYIDVNKMKDFNINSSGFDTVKNNAPVGVNIDNVLQNNESIHTKDDLVKLRNEYNNELYQNHPQEGKRGSISLAKTVNAGEVTTINLTENADVSTVMHEMAHFALNYLKGINATPQLNTLGNWWTENAPDVLKGTNCTEDDLKKYIELLKDGRALQVEPLQDGRALQVEPLQTESLSAEKITALSRATQEYFARGFEAYLREGKSPNAEMRSIFRRMRDWIVAVYKSFAGNLNVNLNDEVRGLFDSLVASDTAIDTQVSLTSTQLTGEAIYTAKEILFRRLVSELKGDHQREIAIFREERAPQIREELENQPRYVVTQRIKDYGGIDRSTVPTDIADRLPRELFSAKDGEGIDWEMAFAVAHDYNEEGTYETEADFVEDIEGLIPIADAVDEQLNLETKALFNSLIEDYDEMSLRAEDTLHNGIDDVGDNIAVSTVASTEEMQDIEGQPEAEGTEEAPQGETLYQDGVTPEQEEYNAIEAKYRDTDEWMKAPNGKPTNLTERQWVQVRTKSFARWFGNWNYNPNIQVEAVDLTGIVDADNVHFKNVKELKDFLTDQYVGNMVTIDSDGSIVNFTAGKTKASIKRKSAPQIAAFRTLSVLIKNSVFFDFEPRDNKSKHVRLYGQDVYYSYMIFDDTPYAVRFKIDVDREDRALTFKDHKVIALEIEERSSVNAGGKENNSNATPPLKAPNELSLQQLTKGVKPNFSKVVDENGEPKVVYHGTESEFNVFDATKSRANMDIQGNFFSPWTEDAKGYGRNVRAFYLNIKNPANSSDGYKALNKYKGQNNAGVNARNDLIQSGFDGVNNDNEEFIAFDPNQIKSATDNTGAFNNDNPNILYQDDVWEYGEDITPEEEALITENESQFLDETEEVLNTLTNQDIGLIDEEGNNKFDKAEAAAEANAPMHTKQEVAQALKTAQIAYSEVVRTHGKEKAQELKKRYPSIFSKKGGTLDEANALLQEESGINVAEDGDGLFDFLMRDEKTTDNAELAAYREGKKAAREEMAREQASKKRALKAERERLKKVREQIREIDKGFQNNDAKSATKQEAKDYLAEQKLTTDDIISDYDQSMVKIFITSI